MIVRVPMLVVITALLLCGPAFGGTVDEAREAAKKAAEGYINDKKKMDDLTKRIGEALNPQSSGEAKNTVKYENDAQVVAEVAKAMHARLKKITMPAQDFDSQQMPPGFVVLNKAVVNGGGRGSNHIKCPANPQQAAAALLTLFIPKLADAAGDWLVKMIKDNAQMRQLAKDASEYYIVAYYQADNRYLTKVEFRKKDTSPNCKAT